MLISEFFLIEWVFNSLIPAFFLVFSPLCLVVEQGVFTQVGGWPLWWQPWSFAEQGVSAYVGGWNTVKKREISTGDRVDGPLREWSSSTWSSGRYDLCLDRWYLLELGASSSGNWNLWPGKRYQPEGNKKVEEVYRKLAYLFFWQSWQTGKRYLPELRVGIMAGVAYCWTGGVYQRYFLFCLI